jgi:hypothetical protein
LNQIVNFNNIFGYWFDGALLCPLCFENLGKVSPDLIITDQDIEAYFSKCGRCGWPLWGLYEYEQLLCDALDPQGDGVNEQGTVRSPFQRFRKEKGLNKKEIASALKTKPFVIGRIEAGKIGLPLDFIEPLQKMGCDAFGLFTAQEDFLKYLRKRRYDS